VKRPFFILGLILAFPSSWLYIDVLGIQSMMILLPLCVFTGVVFAETAWVLDKWWQKRSQDEL